MVCGVLGFEDFMRTDWMRMVLGWVRPNGCFSLNNPRLMGMETELQKVQEKERTLMEDLKEEARLM